MSNKTSIFISYAHQDTIIADEIEKQLSLLAHQGVGGDSLKCFLDTKSIPPGQKYQPIIQAALADADHLIVVYTGEQSVYCGYEIGIYSFQNPNSQQSRPINCLHDVDRTKLPAVVEGYSTTQISRAAPHVANDPAPPEANVTAWWNSPIGLLLRTICAAKGLYTLNHRADNPNLYTIDIAKAASSIWHAFEIAHQEDELSETPVQAGFELTVFPQGNLNRIPPDSILVGSSRAFDILGLNLPLSLNASQAPQITWGDLRAALAEPGRANIPWMDKLEVNIALAVALKVPEPDDVTLRGKGGDNRIYRAILTRHKLFKNGKRRFYVLLVETFDRRFVGDRETSLLLIALTLASRWRFTFFGRWSETLRKFDPARSDPEFRDACKQLEYNMEWMENEGMELGADDQEAMVQAFGMEHKARVERFYSEFAADKAEMKSQLPQTFDDLKADERAKVRAAIIQFLTRIKEQNSEFLDLCIKTYCEKIRAHPS